ncbi:DUF2306 domain-containing protein [Spirosoma montaniterrae]|uniref:DUF2306 domain-containing protein n=1 Tax=Spirosoma montaniterrae TaxID=1178516 RepID=A0A1P9WWP3_9BACT|nr:DUF2306 domain-containing protein [Spirosoma montaniterrae]AQG79760.1 hypothetical protein AWR27_10750 [Spirosoma montaniterrae]
MITDVLSAQSVKAPHSSKPLTIAATTWFVVATVGQWLFGAYILFFYGRSTLAGDFERWNKVLPRGYVAGDWSGNLLIGIHILLAAILVIGGPLQLMPVVRDRFRTFHRRLGKLYVLTAIVVSTAGVVLIWTRGTVGDTFMHVSNSIQALYIISFALLSVRYAKARQFDRHRLWTLRLFMVVNGVWFFRVGLMAWLLINRGPVGFDYKTFTGPFLTVLSLVTYLMPLSLLVLELYFYAQRRQSRMLTLATTIVIALCTVVTAIGVMGATMGMWWPRV